MDTAALVATLREAIALAESRAAALATLTPKVLDGHSDGKRVRYVRDIVTAETLRAVLDMITTDGAA
jgi:hypothetical protein